MVTRADGNIYQGEYKDGKWSGLGNNNWCNGEIYTGNYL